MLLCIHELLPLKGSNSVQQSLLIEPHLFQMLMQHNNALVVSSRAQLATAQQFEVSNSAAMQRHWKQADLIRLQPLSSPSQSPHISSAEAKLFYTLALCGIASAYIGHACAGDVSSPGARVSALVPFQLHGCHVQCRCMQSPYGSLRQPV